MTTKFGFDVAVFNALRSSLANLGAPVGTFIMDDATTCKQIPAEITCPICEAPMVEGMSPNWMKSGRVVSVDEDDEKDRERIRVLVDPIPPGLRVVYCPECVVVYYPSSEVDR